MNWYTKIAQSFSSTGTIRIEPKSKSIDVAKSSNWMIIECDPEIARYYMEQFNFANRAKNVQLMKPSWGGHISLVRSEEPPNKELWGQLEGRSVGFTYDPIVKDNGRNHFYLDVQCNEALDIREQLGLSRNPKYPLHMTIGVRK